VSNEIIYVCAGCRRQLRPDDRVVQTVKIVMVSTLSGPQEQPRVGEWFHEAHYSGMPYREIDRGTLGEVLERS
jgi:hypothetical protein